MLRMELGTIPNHDSITLINGLNVPRTNVLQLGFDNIDGTTAIHRIEAFLQGSANGDCRRVFFLNVHSIWLARTDKLLAASISRADLVLGDGSGLALATKLFGSPMVENLNGTDFVPRLIERASVTGRSVFLLGGTPQISQICKKALLGLHPGLHIVGARSGYFSIDEESEICEEINRVKPDILLVGMGAPLQENWIDRNSSRLSARVCLGVGGLFDFLSGNRKRAPGWMRSLGIEFIYRFMSDPGGKWRRLMVETPWFLAQVMLEVASRRIFHVPSTPK